MAQPQLDHRPITDRAYAPAGVGRVAGGVSRAQFPDVVILHVAVAQQRQGAAGELAASAGARSRACLVDARRGAA